MKVKLAGCIIRDEKGRMLLLHRNTDKYKHWEIPGGKIEAGETAEQAAKREVKEELGVEVEIIKKLGSREFVDGDLDIHYTWFSANIKSGKPTIHEPQFFDQLRIIARDELPKLNQSAGLQKFLSITKKIDLKQKTIDTYNKSAGEFAKYFRGIGPRTKDIDLTFRLAGRSNDPQVLELGCGDGRDAKEILKRTVHYIGIDISEQFIALAQKHVPAARFEVADMVTYNYPKNTDIVFAFASLLHLNKVDFRIVLKKVHDALRQKGVVFISLKYAPTYSRQIKRDQYGQRLFYFYNLEVIREMIGNDYTILTNGTQVYTVRNTTWLDIVLRKK